MFIKADDRGEFCKFQCSLIICDDDGQDLISNDSNTVDLTKFKPHFPLKNLTNNNNGKVIYTFINDMHI